MATTKTIQFKHATLAANTTALNASQLANVKAGDIIFIEDANGKAFAIYTAHGSGTDGSTSGTYYYVGEGGFKYFKGITDGTNSFDAPQGGGYLKAYSSDGTATITATGQGFNIQVPSAPAIVYNDLTVGGKTYSPTGTSQLSSVTFGEHLTVTAGPDGAITVNHSDVGTADASKKKTASGATGTSGTTVQVIKAINVDSKGHVVSIESAAATDTVFTEDVNTVKASGTLTSDQIILGSGSKNIKASGKTIVTTISTTSPEPSNNTVPTSKAVADYVDDKVTALGTPLKFVGAGNTLPGVASSSQGDVYLNTTTHKEYVFDGTNWVEFGDEGSYALKTISVTGTGALEGGGDLTADREITHRELFSGTAGSFGSATQVPKITVDKYGHVTAVTNTTITHPSHSRAIDFTQNPASPTTTTLAPGDEFLVVESIGDAPSSAGDLASTYTVKKYKLPVAVNHVTFGITDGTDSVTYNPTANNGKTITIGEGLDVNTVVTSGNSQGATVSLVKATTSTFGGIKAAGTRTSAITTTQGSTTTNRYYGVEVDSNGKAFVNVPWETPGNGSLKFQVNSNGVKQAFTANQATGTDTTIVLTSTGDGVMSVQVGTNTPEPLEIMKWVEL